MFDPVGDLLYDRLCRYLALTQGELTEYDLTVLNKFVPVLRQSIELHVNTKNNTEKQAAISSLMKRYKLDDYANVPGSEVVELKKKLEELEYRISDTWRRLYSEKQAADEREKLRKAYDALLKEKAAIGRRLESFKQGLDEV